LTSRASTHLEHDRAEVEAEPARDALDAHDLVAQLRRQLAARGHR
jgi:hypothetical protein